MSLVRRVITVAMAASVACVVAPTAASAAPGARAQIFQSCAEAEEAGFTDIRAGEPAYSPDLDRDGDGIACESGGSVAPGAVPGTSPPTISVGPETEVHGASDERLASTGLSWSTGIVLALAMALLMLGHWLVRTGYEHQRWLPGRRGEVRLTVERARTRAPRRRG
jgi:hypothetical protein